MINNIYYILQRSKLSIYVLMKICSKPVRKESHNNDEKIIEKLPT